LRERKILKEIAPHLVHDMDFILPIYDGCIDFPLTIDSLLESHSLTGNVKRLIQTTLVHAGISAYDLLGRSRAPIRFLSKDEYTRPHLLTDEDLLGIRVYSDGKIRSPERLALEAILRGDQEGGKSFNYSEVVGFVKSRAGKVEAVKVRSGEGIHTLRAKVIVNATGPWIDTVNRLHSPSLSRSLLLRVGGIHAAVSSFPGSEVFGKRALVVPTRSPQGQKRLVFMIPEEDHWIVGTTEKEIADVSDPVDYKPSRAELESLFNAVRRVMPAFNLTADSSEEILYVFAGVRPLRRQERDPTTASRKDLIHYDREAGIISVTGKLTPARAIAERVTDLACKLLGMERVPCRTGKTPLPGGETIPERPSQIAGRYRITEQVAENLIRTYGCRYADVLSQCEKDSCLKEEIGTAHIMAQVIYAVEREKAVKISDVIFRRTYMFRATRGFDIALIEVVGGLMATRLGWAREQLIREVELCRDEIENRYKLID